ncbi:tRNA uridine-5-carboxymethylaminomethyl(34) synthesis GTPase MnmE [Jannaschia pohangensis]|uniref:tRNA modification GTPase MnmE n=1 Tax=Jannaschia pohangensis TaxID=390807 RepID=A0A1I3TF86_9RHOB|nr:tRNA uridine-5-carboxymethylaminomethyl(34) synthesis GTPase MnmE [Jannaschia pohangensis]SFJ69280.1 tRNA modification GTPase trmE [Jannaschia pohangensis]
MGDTIFALATAQGKAGLAVIRLSGPDSVAVLQALGGTAPDARSSRVCVLRDAGGLILDHALVLHFAEGASFTGETTIELHLHGSIAVVRAALRAIEATGLARAANPGEFTRRALMNDRLDLTQVQGLADIIDAETEAQHRHAMRVFGGEMADRVTRWRHDLTRAMALLEATIDFADEEIPEDVSPEVGVLLATVARDLRDEIDRQSATARLKAGFEVALIGEPNAGKSSLLNRLTQSDAAIVSEFAGTTRDVIEVRMDVEGIPVTFLDTAGLRDAQDPVEVIGIKRALSRARQADLRLVLTESGAVPDRLVEGIAVDLVVRTKSDLHGGDGVSAVTGDGIAPLLKSIASILSDRVGDVGLFSRERDRIALEEAAAHIELATQSAMPTELRSEELRQAVQALQNIVGGIDVESILGEVFSTFCVGK